VKRKIQIITLSYNVQGKGTGGASGPGALIRAGLVGELRQQGHELPEPVSVQLPPEEEAQYGGWNRVALAGGHLCQLVKKSGAEGSFILGLLADCNGCLGVLGGLQNSLRGGLSDSPMCEGSNSPCVQPMCESSNSSCGQPQGETSPGETSGWPSEPFSRVGLVYVDAHGDYNTPDTSPSGMLGGMPAAVAAGKCLPRLRNRSGILTPVLYSDIIMAGMRDLDELEEEAFAEDGLTVLREKDLIGLSPGLRSAMTDLSDRVDTIYVHVDLDILDPSVAPAAGLPSPGGLTGEQLGRALRHMAGYEKVGALSLVSYRADQDADGRTLQEVMKSLLLATSGLRPVA
jgi:arginase family enzyme